MNSRERVLAAIAHREPDRVPVDLGGTDSSSLTGIAWRRLVSHLGLPLGNGPRIVEPMQLLADVDAGLRRRLGVDVVSLYLEPATWASGKLGDGSACQMPGTWRERIASDGAREAVDSSGTVVARLPKDGLYFDLAATPLASCETVADLERHRDAIENSGLFECWNEPLETLAARAKYLHETTGEAVVFNFYGRLLHGGTFLRGYEQFLCDLAIDTPFAEALLDMLLEAYIRRIDRYAPALRGNIDFVFHLDDLGTQQGPMLSPALYRKIIKPRQARLFAHTKKVLDAAIIFHSCGAVAEFIPDLVEIGADALNPVQVSADGMDSKRLKREFGKDICFWGGGCDSQKVLSRGTVAEVREEVKRRIGDLAPGGGFVFSQVHNIQPDVPPTNIVAMLEAVHEFGG